MVVIFHWQLSGYTILKVRPWSKRDGHWYWGFKLL